MRSVSFRSSSAGTVAVAVSPAAMWRISCSGTENETRRRLMSSTLHTVSPGRISCPSCRSPHDTVPLKGARIVHSSRRLRVLSSVWRAFSRSVCICTQRTSLMPPSLYTPSSRR